MAIPIGTLLRERTEVEHELAEVASRLAKLANDLAEFVAAIERNRDPVRDDLMRALGTAPTGNVEKLADTVRASVSEVADDLDLVVQRSFDEATRKYVAARLHPDVLGVFLGAPDALELLRSAKSDVDRYSRVVGELKKRLPLFKDAAIEPASTTAKREDSADDGGLQKAGTGMTQINSKLRCILFLDVVGWSKLQSIDIHDYVTKALPSFNKILLSLEALQVNTWGDAIVAVFEGARDAANAALRIRDEFRRGTSLEGIKPGLSCRISLHSGEVLVEDNPLINKPDVFGHTVHVAARLEPSTARGHVFCTQQVADNLRAVSGTGPKACPVEGSLDLPKDFGSIDAFVVLWANEDDPQLTVRTSKSAEPRAQAPPPCISTRIDTVARLYRVVSGEAPTGSFDVMSQALNPGEALLPFMQHGRKQLIDRGRAVVEDLSRKEFATGERRNLNNRASQWVKDVVGYYELLVAQTVREGVTSDREKKIRQVRNELASLLGELETQNTFCKSQGVPHEDCILRKLWGSLSEVPVVTIPDKS